MICILSPAKTMIGSHRIGDFCACLTTRSLPVFQEQARVLGKVLKKKTKGELRTLCGVSEVLSTHVKGIYSSMLVGDDDDALSVGISRYNQAALMFDGPAFRGLAAKDGPPEDGAGMQKHLRILTGLYGCVKPGDLIQEHRLCMGTKLSSDADHKDLYTFWGTMIAEEIVEDAYKQLEVLKTSKDKGIEVSTERESFVPLLINCASQEYSKSVLPHLNTDVARGRMMRVVECVFLDGGMVKAAFAKRARGLMSRFACTHDIRHGSDSEVAKMKLFDWEGYRFCESQSSPDRLVFTRSPGDVPLPIAESGGTTKVAKTMKKTPPAIKRKRSDAESGATARTLKAERFDEERDFKKGKAAEEEISVSLKTNTARVTRSRAARALK